MNIWQLIEWGGSLLAIAGTLTLALKLTNISVTWGLWGISNVLHSFLYIHTGQDGLLFLQFGLFTISVLGFINLHMVGKGKLIGKFLFATSLTFVVGSLIVLVLMNLNMMGMLQGMEWAGSLMSLGASMLMASQYKSSFFAWPLWVISGGILIALTNLTGQTGILALQLGFFTLNVIGMMNHSRKLFVERVPAFN